MTRQQILDAIPPLFHLNQWARSSFEYRYEMSRATEAIYWMKQLVIKEAIREGLCWLRLVQVERPCKTCQGTGIFKRWDRYDGEYYDLEDCRRCGASGKVTLKFVETTICGVRWHTPRPKAEFMHMDSSIWDCCALTDWEPEQPGKEIGRVQLIQLLNEAERAICGQRIIPNYESQACPLAYNLHFGTVLTCFVCGYRAQKKWDYAPEIYRPGMRWKQAVCDECRIRALRWPRSWPARLFFDHRGRWNFDPQDVDAWKSRVPLPPEAQSEVVNEWLGRRGIVVGQIPPSDYGWVLPADVFVEVVAHKNGRTCVRIVDSKHCAFAPLYNRCLIVDTAALTGQKRAQIAVGQKLAQPGE